MKREQRKLRRINRTRYTDTRIHNGVYEILDTQEGLYVSVQSVLDALPLSSDPEQVSAEAEPGIPEGESDIDELEEADGESHVDDTSDEQEKPEGTDETTQPTAGESADAGEQAHIDVDIGVAETSNADVVANAE